MIHVVTVSSTESITVGLTTTWHRSRPLTTAYGARLPPPSAAQRPSRIRSSRRRVHSPVQEPRQKLETHRQSNYARARLLLPTVAKSEDDRTWSLSPSPRCSFAVAVTRSLSLVSCYEGADRSGLAAGQMHDLRRVGTTWRRRACGVRRLAPTLIRAHRRHIARTLTLGCPPRRRHSGTAVL